MALCIAARMHMQRARARTARGAPSGTDARAALSCARPEQLVALTTGVDDESLVAAKAQLKYNMMLQMDGTSPNAEEIGRQMLVYGRRMTLAETFARIDMIEPADVTRVAEKVIWDQEVSFAAMGPNLKYAFDINGLRRGTFWHRL